jgi:3-oxoadipate enol-lactonase
MPTIVCKNKKIHYEIFGEGEPLVIVNGIMMSCDSWLPFKDALSRKHKLFIFDMVDQGRSDKMSNDPPYTQDYHVEVMKEMFDQLGFKKIHLFGISYGGEVAIKFALAHQEMLHSLILANTPFKTTGMLRYCAQRWEDVFKSYDGISFFREISQSIYAESFYEKNAGWLKEKEAFFKQALPHEWYDGMIRMLHSGDNYDPENDLHRIKVRTLVIGGSEDRLTPPIYQRQIAECIPNSSLIIVEGAAHVLPYEKPYAFCAALLGFLEVCDQDICTISFSGLT